MKTGIRAKMRMIMVRRRRSNRRRKRRRRSEGKSPARAGPRPQPLLLENGIQMLTMIPPADLASIPRPNYTYGAPPLLSPILSGPTSPLLYSSSPLLYSPSPLLYSLFPTPLRLSPSPLPPLYHLEYFGLPTRAKQERRKEEVKTYRFEFRETQEGGHIHFLKNHQIIYVKKRCMTETSREKKETTFPFKKKKKKKFNNYSPPGPVVPGGCQRWGEG